MVQTVDTYDHTMKATISLHVSNFLGEIILTSDQMSQDSIGLNNDLEVKELYFWDSMPVQSTNVHSLQKTNIATFFSRCRFWLLCPYVIQQQHPPTSSPPAN